MRCLSLAMALSSLMLVAAAGPVSAEPGDQLSSAWGKSRRAAADEMIARLDMTSFRNSIGPGRAADRHTLAQYGFTDRSSFDDGWAYAKMADNSWQFGIFVLTNGKKVKQLCVTDDALGGPTYHTTIAIEVRRDAAGRWESSKDLGSVVGCDERR